MFPPPNIESSPRADTRILARPGTPITRGTVLQWLAAAAGTLPAPALSWAHTLTFPGKQHSMLGDLAALVLPSSPGREGSGRVAEPFEQCFRTALIPLAALTFLCVFCAPASGETLERLQNESPVDFAKRILPTGNELAHPPLEGSFGSSDHNIVLLFRRADDVNTNYTGWVLVPDRIKPELYTKYVLPPMKEIPGLFDIAVKSVLYARTASGPETDLIVLFKYHRNGRSSDWGYASNVYHWDGRQFTFLDDVSRKLSGLRTATQVRLRLKANTSSFRRPQNE